VGDLLVAGAGGHEAQDIEFPLAQFLRIRHGSSKHNSQIISACAQMYRSVVQYPPVGTRNPFLIQSFIPRFLLLPSDCTTSSIGKRTY
jgi:hypothetical protein